MKNYRWHCDRFSRICLSTLVILIGCHGLSFADDPKGPVGVIGLGGQDDNEAVVKLSQAAYLALKASHRVDVLAPQELIERLGGQAQHDHQKADLDRLQGLFKQGYLQSYSFEYRKAITSLTKVLSGLRYLLPNQVRWDLFIKTNIFMGIAFVGLKDEQGCLRSFAAVLRTRPEMDLARRDYSPKTIKLWKKAKQRLRALQKGKLVVETEPAGAAVYLDGIQVGTTPLIGDFYYGRYHLHVQHATVGDASRWIEIGKSAARLRLQLSFEGALSLTQAQPVLKIPKGVKTLPQQWWPWLGARLGVRYLITVALVTDQNRKQLVASLVDLERGRRVREGWVEQTHSAPSGLRSSIGDLMDFLITGQAGANLKVTSVQPGSKDPGFKDMLVPPLPIEYKVHPWYRRWWPYATAGSVVLAGAVGAHLASESYTQSASQAVTENDINRNERLADVWLGVAITGYALAAGLVITGVFLDITFKPSEVSGGPAAGIVPLVGPDTFGFGLNGVF
ncbi:MAG: PEGA domain-containing protein [Deltaproteobacteria bacterium]|nr:PEGA domain-containing protein [Deltaproteobacteria bacterium]